MAKLPANRTDILAIYAHPDDESWACAGALSSYADRGMQCRLVTATAGEAGFDDAVRKKTPQEELKTRRKSELAAAAGIIGLDSFEILGLADGGLEYFGADSLADLLAERIERHRPLIVLTFDETGVTGHRDHITVHEATTKAFSNAAPDGSRLLYSILPEKVGAEVQEAIRGLGLSIGEPEFGLSPWRGLPAEKDGSAGAFCVPDSRISVAVDVRSRVDSKKSAILAHTSQVGETAMLESLPPAVLEAFLGWEYYQLAAGPEFSETPAGDLFEGMR